MNYTPKCFARGNQNRRGYSPSRALIPAGVPHTVVSHNGRPFTAYKGSTSGVRSVTEHGDGKGSIEDLAGKQKA